MTIAKVADSLKVTEQTIFQLAGGGEKTLAFEVGGSWRFSKADFDRWIKLQKTFVTKVDRANTKIVLREKQ
jgi:excisionase family DNA binding protein